MKNDTNKSAAVNLAVCEFQKDSKVFPVEIGIHSNEEASRRAHWMKIGAGQFQDWRIIPMAELREYLLAGRVVLDCFTAQAQADKRAQIMEASE